MSDLRVSLIESLLPCLTHDRAPSVTASLLGHEVTAERVVSTVSLRSSNPGSPEQILVLKHTPATGVGNALPCILEASCGHATTKLHLVDGVPPIITAPALALAVAEALRLPTTPETVEIGGTTVPLSDLSQWQPRYVELCPLPWFLFGGLLMAEPQLVKLRSCLHTSDDTTAKSSGGGLTWSRQHLLLGTPDKFALGVGFHGLLVPAALNVFPVNDVLQAITAFVDAPGKERVSARFDYGDGQLTLIGLFERLREFFWTNYLQHYKPSA